MSDDLYSFAKFMGAFREGRDRRRRERIATMGDRLDYANRLRNLPVRFEEDGEAEQIDPPLSPPPTMRVQEIRATPPSLEQTEVLDAVQEAMQQIPSDPPKIESIAGEGNTHIQDPRYMPPLEHPESTMPILDEETEDEMLERRRLRDLESEREEERKRLEEEQKRATEEGVKRLQNENKPKPKPEPPAPKPKKEEDDEKEKERQHEAAISQMTASKPPKEEAKPAPASKTSKENKKTLASAMTGKVEPKKTPKEPKAKKKDEPESNKNNALARAMELKQKREKKAEEESTKPKAKPKPKAKEEKPAEPEEDENEMRFVMVQGKGITDEKISREEAKKRGYHLKAKHKGKDVWVDKSKVEEKKDPPKKEEKKESLNTELKEGAKKLTSDEKVANLLGSKKD